MAIAEFLEAHPKVKQVAYPGLPSFAQHELSKRQASGFGAMLWFEVEGGVAAGKKLMDNIELWTLAENLGSVESLARRMAWRNRLLAVAAGLLVIAGVFYMEMASVIIQVGYFKWTGGRRVFLCSPIHHHFHLKG